MTDHCHRRIHILLQRQHLEPTGLPGLTQHTALNNMQGMQFDSIRASTHHLLQSGKAIHGTLARKTDNQMGADLETTTVCPDHRILVGAVIMAPIDPLERLVMGAL